MFFHRHLDQKYFSQHIFLKFRCWEILSDFEFFSKNSRFFRFSKFQIKKKKLFKKKRLSDLVFFLEIYQPFLYFIMFIFSSKKKKRKYVKNRGDSFAHTWINVFFTVQNERLNGKNRSFSQKIIFLLIFSC